MKHLSRILYHNLTLLAIAALLWGALAFSPVAPARAATLTVNTLSDENDHSCSDGDCSLRDAIESATPGDEIGFDAGLSGGTITLASTLEINKNLEISSTIPITVSGGNTVRVLKVGAGADVVLGNLTIAFGYSYWYGGGGGIYSEAAQLIVNHCTFYRNMAEYGDGGGIYNDLESTLEVNQSTFIGNTAIEYPGEYPYGGSGGAVANDGIAAITSGAFNNNQAAIGGGIHNHSTIVLTNNSFSENSAFGVPYGAGAGIYNDGEATLTNNTFTKNDAYYQGGGVYNYSVLSLQNNILANSTSGGDCVTNHPLAANSGNLIEDGSCEPVLSGDPLLGEPSGSPAYFPLLPGSPALDAGDDATCTAADQRGLPRPQDGNGDGLAICDIGAIEMHNDLFVADISHPEGDSASNNFQFTISRYAPQGVSSVHWAAADGSAAAPADYSLASGNITFLEGETTHTITVSIQGDTSPEPDETFHVILSNPSQANLLRSQATATIQTDDPILLQVTRSGAGSGLVTSQPPGIACGADCEESYPQDTIVTIEATPDPGYAFGHWSSEGHTLSYDPSFSLRLENVATKTIDAMFCTPTLVTNLDNSGPGSLRQAIAEVQPGCPIGFEARLSGGTIRLASTLEINKSLTITSTVPITISGGNSVKIMKIGVSNTNIDVALNNLTIAFGSAVLVGDGGGVYNRANTLTINKCIFYQNISEIGNVAGGIYNGTASTLTVNQSAFIGNRTTYDYDFTEGYVVWAAGGGLYNDGIAIIDNSTFIGNETYSVGGGVLNSGTMTIRNSTLGGNHANKGGGGIYNLGILEIRNNTLDGNSADSGSGGIENWGSLSLYNNIIAHSTGEDCTNQDLITGTGNLIEDGSCNPALSGDPLLGELIGSPAYFPLLPGSPAIDAGNAAACPPTDQRSLPRPQGTACDIGAVEMPPLEVAKRVSPNHNVPLHATVTYTITLSNYDLISPTQVFLTDTLPAEVDFGQWLHQPAGATLADGQITWNGPITPSSAISFTFTATHTGWFGDVVTNTVQVSGTHQTTNASAVFAVRTNAAPSAKPDAYTAIHTTPLHVPALQGVLANDDDPDGDPLTATLLSAPLTGTLDLLPDGSFTYTPTLGFIGPLTFTYTASDGFYTDTTTVLLNVTKSADLAVSQHMTATATTITYTVTLSNLGPEDASGAIFSDQLSPFVGEVQWTCAASAGAACPSPSGVGSPSQQTIPILPSGGVVTYTITGHIQAGSPLGNAATITPPADVTDPNPANNQSVVGTPYTLFLPLVVKNQLATP